MSRSFSRASPNSSPVVSGGTTVAKSQLNGEEGRARVRPGRALCVAFSLPAQAPHSHMQTRALEGLAYCDQGGCLGRIFIYLALHSSTGLDWVPGPVLNPGDTEWGQLWCLRRGEGGCRALKRDAVQEAGAMPSFSCSARARQAPALYQTSC